MHTTERCSPEVRERAVRMVLEHAGTTEGKERLKELERGSRELRRASEILRQPTPREHPASLDPMTS